MQRNCEAAGLPKGRHVQILQPGISRAGVTGNTAHSIGTLTTKKLAKVAGRQLAEPVPVSETGVV